MRCVVLSHAQQRPAARIVEECVIYDYQQGRKVPPAPWLRDMVGRVAAEEGEEGRNWRERRAEVENRVRRLEEGSVLSGKKEDLGSAKK